MYKPNGEEPMTKQEEMRRKAVLADQKAQRGGDADSSEALRAAFYSALFRSATVRPSVAAGSFESAR